VAKGSKKADVPVQNRPADFRYVQSKPRHVNERIVELSADGFIYAAEVAKRSTKTPTY
jgi:hypothetical protein